MSLRKVYNLNMSSGNPSSQTGILPGGAGSIVSGTTPNPMIGYPRCEEGALGVLDVTHTTPAVNGKLLVMYYTVTNQGCCEFSLSAAAEATLPRGTAGVVQAAAATSGAAAQVVIDGPVLAYCTALTGHTISPGDALSADGAGNLHKPASAVAGQIVAVAMGALDPTATPTLLPVNMGGY